MEQAVFELAGKRYQVQITMSDAYKELPKRFGLELLKMFANEEKCQETMQELIFDEDKTLHLMHMYIERQNGMMTFDTMLEQLENLTVLDSFRDAFWAAIVNFSGPLKKQVLIQIWEQFKKELKEVRTSRPQSDV